MLDVPDAAGGEDVLSQATRSRLFALLDEMRRPAGTAELAERLKLHPNGVRLHLERLESAGLVTRTRVRRARGRPADSWAIAPDARPGGDPPRAYRDLGRWLARAMQSRRVGPRSIEAIGEEIGGELAAKDIPAAERSDSGALMLSALAALGFQPSVQSSSSNAMTVCLGNCPYRDAVRENQAAICTLHKGITKGLLHEIDPQARLARFQPRDPDVAGCTLQLGGIKQSATPGN